MKSNPHKNQTDEELMVQIQDHHSHSAIVELHARYSGRLLGYFIKMLNKDVDLAQDFVQELFLKILEKNHLFDPKKKFYTWVFTIASNMCKTAYRKVGTSQTFDTEKHDHLQTHYGDNLAEKELFLRALQTSIDELESVQKQAFVLRFLEHFSLNEIAEIAETSVGTVKSRLFYATQKVAKQLQEFDPSFESTVFKLS
ncbi:MAG: RNA polymerase sigma factor [Crocinitomicaceae bacterium]